MKGILYKALTVVVCMLFVSVAFAQNGHSDYQIKGDRVLYNGRTIAADARSFKILGHGYAKDNMNVYLDGMVLRYVDPSTFRLYVKAPERRPFSNIPRGRGMHESDRSYAPKYVVTNFDVMFDGRKVQGASANSFKDLHDGYGKDSFNVYYCGKRIQSASADSFVCDGNGYAHDTFRTYYCGDIVR